MKPWIVCLSLAWCWPAAGQPASQKIAFEVASIKPAESSPMNQIRTNMSADGAMLRYTNVSLKDCIRVAHRVKNFQIEGPDWIESTRFDIVAKLPAGSSQQQIPEMLQSLLTDRFQLTLHRETKDHAIYALVAVKGGPHLKPAEVSTDEGAAPGATGGRGGAMTMQVDGAGVHLKANSATLATLGEMISRFSERPVVDMTGIQGQYDFDLVFSPETMRGVSAAAHGAGPLPAGGDRPLPETPEGPGSIYDSVQKYGLKLESRKAPMEVLVVDRIEKAPIEN